jgi:hypothetical protein
MRKWHRWSSVIFAVFLLWIAVTGVLSQIVPLFGKGDGPRNHGSGAASAPAFVCSPDYTCRQKPAPGGSRALVSLLHDLHSGAKFGPIGVVIATLSGFAMVFLGFSGLWMYIRMWRNRHSRALKPGWFWT